MMNRREDSPANKLVITIMWISMLMSCVIYLVIAEFVPVDPAIAPLAYPIMLNAFTLISICMVAVGVYFGWARTRLVEEEDRYVYFHRATLSMIVCIAMFEVVGLLGLMLHAIGNTAIHRPFIAVAFILILVAGSRIGPIFSNFESLKDMEDARRF